MYELMQLLLDAAENFVRDNTSALLNGISLAQCNFAQRLLNKMREAMEESDLQLFNKCLIRLYAVIPRSTQNAYIAKILARNGFLEYELDKLEERIDLEQEFCDNVTGAVKAVLAGNTTNIKTKEQTKIDNICLQNGLTIVPATKEDIDFIKSNMQGDSRKFIRAWKTTNKNTDIRYKDYLKNKNITNTRTLWHGSGTSNFLSILSNGLQISKASYGMFGKGIYFAKDFDKSRGYCSVCNSRWRGGSDDTAMLALFDVAIGNPWHLDDAKHGIDASTIGPYDSVWAHKGAHLHRDEFIVYNQNACTIRYIVETK